MRLITDVVTESGVRFETGKPVRFPFIRNTVASPRPSRHGHDQFQQKLEPAGAYLLHDTVRNKNLARGWVSGIATFRKPLVLPWSISDRYDDQSWKALVARAFRARGKRLTQKLLAHGYDAIVTVDRHGGTSEIIALDPRTQLVFD